ncbi:MAG: M43 family zinc metalloprotease, partial [Saprospiraceae bacterium]
VIDIHDFAGIRDAPYSSSRWNVFTHLIGNFLGIYSLWGLTFCADDYVDDTPIHNVPNIFESYFAHFTACPGHEGDIEMINNFMDVGNDDLKTMFTLGQVERLKRVLSESTLLRKEIINCDDNIVSLQSNGTELSIHPNPANGMTHITVKNSKNRLNYISIHESTSGKLIYETSFDGDNDFFADLNGFASETYLVTHKQNDTTVANIKIVKL